MSGRLIKAVIRSCVTPTQCGIPILFWMLLFASPSQALNLSAQYSCIPGIGSFAPGWSDGIDATPYDTNGSNAPYNTLPTDDAIVCVDQFNASNGIALGDATSFQNEIANVASHEMGHLLGLEHADGGAGTLMQIVFPFNGVDRGFETAAESAVLDSLSFTQIIWLDFLALQPGLLPDLRPWFESPELARHGITGEASSAAAMNAIVSNIVSDYTGTDTQFFTTQSAAAAAAGTLFGDSTLYSTITFAAIPEPSTALLLSAGLALLAIRPTSRN